MVRVVEILHCEECPYFHRGFCSFIDKDVMHKGIDADCKLLTPSEYSEKYFNFDKD